MDVPNKEKSPARVRNQDSAADALGSKLRQARRRVRVLLLLRGGSQGLLCAAMGVCALMVLNKAWLFPLPSPAQTSGLLAGVTAAGALFAFRPRLKDLDMARLLESRAALQERLSSALEFRQQGADFLSPFYGEQWADANRCAAQINVKALFPARVPRALLPAALLLTVCCLIPLAPGLPGLRSGREQPPQDTEAVRSAAVAIEQAAKQAGSDAEQPVSPQARQAAQEVKSLAAKMKQGGMDKKQSLVALHKLIERFARQEKTDKEAVPSSSPEQSAPQGERSSDRRLDNAAGLHRTAQAGEAARPQNAPEPLTGKPGSKQLEAKDATSTGRQSTEKQRLQNTPPQAATRGEKQQARQTGGRMPPKPGQAQGRQNRQAAQAFRRKDPAPGGTKPDTENVMQNAPTLQKLAQALKAGQQALAAGSKSGAGGKGAGQGTAGKGDPTRALPDQANAQSRLVSVERNQKSQSISRAVDARKSAQGVTASLQASEPKPNAIVRGTKTTQGTELQTVSTGQADPARSRAPYYKAYETGRKQAESALEKETVPAVYKQQVRDYFNSIHP